MRALARAVPVVLSCLLACGQANPLAVKCTEGASGTAPRRIAVRVEDASGRPVSGASVAFHLISESAPARFASGFSTESLMTDSEGTASVLGIRWPVGEGNARVRVVALSGGSRGELDIPVRLGSTEAKSAIADKAGGGSGMKWLLIAGAAGGALAAVALGGGSKGTTASRPGAPPPVSAITIQPPTVVIGRP